MQYINPHGQRGAVLNRKSKMTNTYAVTLTSGKIEYVVASSEKAARAKIEVRFPGQVLSCVKAG